MNCFEKVRFKPARSQKINVLEQNMVGLIICTTFNKFWLFFPRNFDVGVDYVINNNFCKCLSFLQGKTQDFSMFERNFCKKEKLLQIAHFWNILLKKSQYFAMIERKFKHSDKIWHKNIKKNSPFKQKSLSKITNFLKKISSGY